MRDNNGRLTPAELAPVLSADGRPMQLGNNAATAFLAMDAACYRATGLRLWPAWDAGAYRDLEMQADIGGKNPFSKIKIAAPGFSTHGWADRVDIGSFPPLVDLGRFGDDGRRRRAWVIKNAPYYGWFREFGEADPNHYAHDGRTKAAWRQYRLDWDEMVSKAELEQVVEATVEKVLNKKLMTSEVSGKPVSVLQVLPKMHLNLFELNEREKAAAAPPTSGGASAN